MFLAVLPLVLLLQALPPPAGRVATAILLHGVGGGRDVIVAVPAPSASPGAASGEDCHCGVPNSPRGPR